MTSIALNENWDIFVDGSGNLATVTGNAAIAQDVACACRTWLGELWYNRALGVNYKQIFSGRPTKQLLKQSLINQGMTVPGVGNITCYLTLGPNREIGGQLQISNAPGGTIIAVVNSTSFAGDAPWWVFAGGNTAIAGQ